MVAETNSIFLSPIAEGEIITLLQALNTNISAGHDDLKPAPIKAVSRLISAPLTHICNISLSQGIFPNKMKVARVCVLHKGGSLHDMNNYRPISVLPLFSKILEQVINGKLVCYLAKKNLIAQQQYGFQKKKSTEMALLNIKNKLINNFENQLYTIGVFLDFRKAFDSIKHDVLLQKLPFYGIRGIPLDLIRNYLSHRVQYTVINGFQSELKQIKYGVPQGSILGPLLFLLYINDLVNIAQTPDIILYADDTNVFFYR